MAFWKAVFAKAQHLRKDGLGKGQRVAVGHHAVDQALFKLVHAARALPGGHGPAQGIGLGG